MPVRVIAGSAKGRRLKMVPGDSTRPVMDRVKEACFSIIGRRVVDTNFLDLFAGTGSVGIEALSRGARRVLFTDTDRRAIQTIHENLTLTHFNDQATVRRADAFALLKSPPNETFDIIYIAPPQFKNLWLEALQALDNNPGWMTADTWVIVQIEPSEFTETAFNHLVLTDQRTYGKTLLCFYEVKPDSTDEAEV